jgi:hypothetical protein
MNGFMTDSTTDNPGDGAFAAGTSVDELFGELEDADSGEEGQAGSTDGDDGERTDSVEDTTAADIFDQLRADATDEGSADDVLADDSPDDIIASADEPEPEPEAAVHDELLADDDELEDLLLTGRTKEQEFLWIETDDSDDNTVPDKSDDSDDSTVSDDSTGRTLLNDSDEAVDGETPATETGPSPSTDATVRNAEGDTDAVDEIADRLAETDPGPDEDPSSHAETEATTASNSSIAVSPEERGPNSTAQPDSDDTETDTAADEAESTTDAGSSGFFGRLWAALTGLF